MNYNITAVPVGEAICYHKGFLAIDRTATQFLGYEQDDFGERKLDRSGLPIPITGGLTNEAAALNMVASDLFKRSTALWEKGQDIFHGTGEFELYQHRVSHMVYEYWARRIKAAPKKSLKR